MLLRLRQACKYVVKLASVWLIDWSEWLAIQRWLQYAPFCRLMTLFLFLSAQAEQGDGERVLAEGEEEDGAKVDTSPEGELRRANQLLGEQWVRDVSDLHMFYYWGY